MTHGWVSRARPIAHCVRAGANSVMMGDVSRAPDVLILGDANLDLVLRGDVRPRWGQAEQLLESADLTLGGSASLVAHGLARLGVRVRLCAAVGRDRFGDLTLDILSAAGVDTTHVVRREVGSTGLSVILSDTDDRSILTSLGVVGSLTPRDLPDLAGIGHLHVASPYLTTTLRPHLPDLITQARARGIRTSLDTNDDPASAWSGLAELVASPQTLFPNRTEVLRWATAMGLSEQSWSEAAQRIADMGPDLAVKVGSDGGTAFSSSRGPMTATPPAVEVVDTTGAGDSFNAGWIAAKVAGLTDNEALSWAVHAGSLSTRAAGGAEAQASRSELIASTGIAG